MSRTIATHLIVLALGLGLGLGAVAIAQHQTARSASDAQIVRAVNANGRKVDVTNRQLREMNRSLSLVNKNLAGQDGLYLSPSLRELLRSICRGTTQYGLC